MSKDVRLVSRRFNPSWDGYFNPFRLSPVCVVVDRQIFQFRLWGLDAHQNDDVLRDFIGELMELMSDEEREAALYPSFLDIR